MIKKSVLIIGASSDIGKTIAKTFAENNYNIIATYNTNNCNEIIEMCKKNNVEAQIYKIDLKNSNEIEEKLNTIFANSSYIDCAICCAGLSLKEVLLCDETIENINNLININFRGIIICNKIISKYFLKQKHGNIINISSIYGIYGGACESVYSACKAGVIGLTKSLAQELSPFGIRVNAVAPGFIQTKMTKNFNEEEKKQIIDRTPLKRLGNTEDVANTVFFLASDKASFITGEIIEVTGGAIRF